MVYVKKGVSCDVKKIIDGKHLDLQVTEDANWVSVFTTKDNEFYDHEVYAVCTMNGGDVTVIQHEGWFLSVDSYDADYCL